jgi:hypothetical protein
MKIPTLTCPKCAHAWSPRLPNPRACPRCKRYLGDGTGSDRSHEEVGDNRAV